MKHLSSYYSPNLSHDNENLWVALVFDPSNSPYQNLAYKNSHRKISYQKRYMDHKFQPKKRHSHLPVTLIMLSNLPRFKHIVRPSTNQPLHVRFLEMKSRFSGTGSTNSRKIACEQASLEKFETKLINRYPGKPVISYWHTIREGRSN